MAQASMYAWRPSSIANSHSQTISAAQRIAEIRQKGRELEQQLQQRRQWEQRQRAEAATTKQARYLAMAQAASQPSVAVGSTAMVSCFRDQLSQLCSPISYSTEQTINRQVERAQWLARVSVDEMRERAEDLEDEDRFDEAEALPLNPAEGSFSDVVRKLMSKARWDLARELHEIEVAQSTRDKLEDGNDAVWRWGTFLVVAAVAATRCAAYVYDVGEEWDDAGDD